MVFAACFHQKFVNNIILHIWVSCVSFFSENQIKIRKDSCFSGKMNNKTEAVFRKTSKLFYFIALTSPSILAFAVL